MRTTLAFCAMLLCCCGSAAAESPIAFNRDIRPILADKCFHCHGPDSATRQADLRLDQEEEAKRNRGGYAAVTPGQPESSELVARILSDDDSQMPPPDSGRSLTAHEKQLLRDWVQHGAEWEPHWSFVPPTRPPLPAVRNARWIRNGIDHFVLSRLESAGRRPNRSADPATLIRRLTLDLTGLPPTPAEVEHFLADRSPGAYERLVDRLLDSPRYGETMAVAWLDAARFADTDGYQNDGPRSMWRWRDWVIAAYNADMPFDQFTIEQLAGDLLPDATLTQRIATGFNRNHRYNSEAGLVLEEFLLENAVDRVETTGTVFMGLTLGLARCHDHKYDPFSQREFYQLLAYFNNITESGRAVKYGNSEPWVVAPTETQQERLDRLDTRVSEARRERERTLVRLDPALQAWAAERDRKAELPPLVGRGLQQRFRLDAPDEVTRTETGTLAVAAGVCDDAFEFDGQTVVVLGEAGEVRGERRSSVTFWCRPDDVSEGVIVSRQRKNDIRPGLAIELAEGRLRFFIITRWVAGVAAVETVEKLEPGAWVHVTVTNDGSQIARGMRIYLNGQRTATRKLFNTNSNTGGTTKGMWLRVGGGVQGPRFRGSVDELRFYDRTLFADEIVQLAVPADVETVLATSSADRSAAEQRKLRLWFLEHRAPDTVGARNDRYDQLRMARQKLWDSLPTTMVMEERRQPRDTNVRVRGVYDQLGERVTAEVPAAVNVATARVEKNRLGFAQWLVDGQHPLTARVAVNRFWQHYFGVGLVKTSEDFGFQGELPSHPQLLDWLAEEFVASGWNVKQLQRLIVCSATYRQSSRAESDKIQWDPENRLLARASRQRLSAHSIRDQALAVSGLLSERIGGPSVSPHQPENLWREMSNMRYELSSGGDLYRRSLYTIWKRTVAPPTMAILDAADRERCIVRTGRTNTPLQALTLLNEETFVEAARRLAQRMDRESGKDPLAFGFRLVAAREPQPRELEVLMTACTAFQRRFEDDREAAKALLGADHPAEEDRTAELAAYTVLANILLNLDEVITKE